MIVTILWATILRVYCIKIPRWRVVYMKTKGSKLIFWETLSRFQQHLCRYYSQFLNSGLNKLIQDLLSPRKVKICFFFDEMVTETNRQRK